MLASRAVKPKLSLSISTAAQSSRPNLSLRSPVASMAPIRSPVSPLPPSPTTRHTMLNKRGMSTMQQPTYSYTNNSSSKSILKKGQATSVARRQLQFSEKPVIHCVSPIEDADYYGGYKKMSRDERRWMQR